MSEWRIGLAEVRISDSEIAAMLDAFRSNWLTMGPQTADLEKEFAAWSGRSASVAVSSGSAGLHLSCLAAGIGPGDEVVVPATSFVACAHAPHWSGAEAVFCDIGSVNSPLMTRDTVEAALTPRTKAVMVVHMFGYAVDVEPLRALCDERNLILIEDCSEAPGASDSSGVAAGTLGDVSVWSFFAKSPIPAGEGGMLSTDDLELEKRLRLLRSHAMTSVTWDRHRGHAETYDVVDLGFNYRIDEPRAALVRALLGGLDRRLELRRSYATAYRSRIAGIDEVSMPFDASWSSRSSHFAIPVLLPENSTRDALRLRLSEAGIQSTIYPSLTQLSICSGLPATTPLASDFAERHLCLPISGDPEETADAVVDVIAELVA